MKTIAVINQKGGVGKTACAYNLAYSLSQRLVTCLIDLDPSANATKGFDCHGKYNYNSYDFMVGQCDIEECAVSINSDDNLWIIPSHIKLALAQRELQSKTFRESILYKKLNEAEIFDEIIIIDCSPTLSDLTINAIYAADFILVPVTYEDDALEGLNDLFSVITEIKQGQNYKYKILRNQKDSRKTKTNEYIENQLKPFLEQGYLFSTIIRQDEAINQAKIERKTIFEYSPNSHGAHDFKLLTEELLNEKANW